MSDNISKHSPDDFDWPATIFLYVVLVIMGVGMCFCLRKANRLIPNRFSFPLVDRGERRQRGFHDLGAEEEGLLSHHYSDIEDEDDAVAIDNQNALQISRRSSEDEQDVHQAEEDDFGHLQTYNTSNNSDQDDGVDGLYKSPYRDNDVNNNK